MAFRSTAFDPVNPQHFKQNDPSINFNEMNKNLALEIARMKQVDAKKTREIEKIALESDEIK